MGKSLYVKQKAVSLKQSICSDNIHVTIPIHGPVVTADTITEYLKEHIGRDNCTIYHLDIAPRVSLVWPAVVLLINEGNLSLGFG